MRWGTYARLAEARQNPLSRTLSPVKPSIVPTMLWELQGLAQWVKSQQGKPVMPWVAFLAPSRWVLRASVPVQGSRRR